MDLETFDSIKEKFSLAHMSKPALIGVVAVLVMVAVAAGRLLIGTATASEFEIVKGEASSVRADVDATSDAEPSSLYVHVSGEVASPGLVEVSANARVADAVQAAGGFTQDAEPASVNLARTLTDGEQIVIAAKGSQEQLQSAQAPAGQQAASAQAATTSAGLVNINTANAELLISLPGIGESTAQKIIADRQANGPFKTIDDLKRVSGIGDKKFEALSGMICV